jgi:hypothetical protein
MLAFQIVGLAMTVLFLGPLASSTQRMIGR